MAKALAKQTLDDATGGAASLSTSLSEIATDLIKSGSRPCRKGAEITKIHQSLQKKMSRNQSNWGGELTDAAGEQLLRDTVENSVVVVGHGDYVDFWDASGRGVRMKGGEFWTFLDPPIAGK